MTGTGTAEDKPLASKGFDARTSRQPGKAESWALRLVPPFFYLLCSMIMYSLFLAHPTRGVPGGPDGTLYCWYFEWTEFSLTHLHNPLVSDWLNAPDGINVMWNTGVFLLTVLFTPVTYFFGPIVAGGLAMVLSPAASATTCYLVLRKITGTGWRAAVVSLLYGFGPFFAGQSGHLHLTFAVFPPLILLFGWQLFITQPAGAPRLGLKLGLVVGLQLLVGEEVLVLAAVCAFFAVLALAAVYPRQIAARIRYALVGIGVGLLTCLVIAGAGLYYQFFGSNPIHGGFPAGSQRLGLAGIVTPSYLERLAPAWAVELNRHRLPALGGENTGYLGLPLVLLTLCVCAWLLHRKDRFVWWWLLSVGAALLMSFGSSIQLTNGITLLGAGPWRLIRMAPLLNGVVPVRFSLITTLLVVVLLGWWLARLPRGPVASAGVAAVILSYLAMLPAFRYEGIQPVRTPEFFSTRAVNRLPAGSTALVLPVSVESHDGARVMRWQMSAHLRFKMAGGWGVFSRDGHATYEPRLPAYLGLLTAAGQSGRPSDPAAVALARPSVSASGIDFIVITAQQPNASSVAAAASELTGCRLESVADVTVCPVPK